MEDKMNIGYEFKNKDLLQMALTHISLANEKSIESNQRLEFLGDSILSFIVAEYIYNQFTDLAEGRLTEIRAAAVCEKSLAEAARKMDLGSGLMFGKSEKVCNGFNKASILADTYEAVLAAIYLDGGIDAAKDWVMGNLKDSINATTAIDMRNYKSEIQNYFQKRDKGREVVKYNLLERIGPDHMPTFKVEAVYKGKVIGTGKGKNRKIAEQAAAKMALERI